MVYLEVGHLEANEVNEMNEINEMYKIYKKNNREHEIFGIIEVSTYGITLALVKLLLNDIESNLSSTFYKTPRKETKSSVG